MKGARKLVGERLYELRKDAGLTQDQLAEILRVNKHSISSYERDKSEPPDIIKIQIARYFNVSVDYLLGLVDQPSPVNSAAGYMRLPAGFPASRLSELGHYANYLTYIEQQKI